MRPPPEEGPIEFEFVDALTLERMYHDRALPVDAVPTHLPKWNVRCRDAGGGKGLAFGWHITAGGSTGAGKALALDTPIPTVKGWSTMLDLSVGDTVFDEGGQPCQVTNVSEIMFDHDCYEITFSDGAQIVADGDHIWMTWSRGDTYRSSPWRRVTTREIFYTHDMGQVRPRARYSIPVTKPLVCPEDRELPVAPYVLGLWLGDGSSRCAQVHIGHQDVEEVTSLLRACGVRIKALAAEGLYSLDARRGCVTNAKLSREGAAEIRAAYKTGEKMCALAEEHGVSASLVSLIVNDQVWKERDEDWRPSMTTRLRDLGVLRNKHIPSIYQRTSVAQRMELLRGLMDSDGCCDRRGRCEFTNTNKRLAEDTAELLRGLGFQVRVTEGRAMLDGKDCGPKYRLHFTAHRDNSPFHLSRKTGRLRRPFRNGHERRTGHRMIVDVCPVPSVPVRCIQVSSRSHLFLAGECMIPTHNSLLGLNLSAAAMDAGEKVGYLSLEMSFDQLVTRILAIKTRTKTTKLEQGDGYDPEAFQAAAQDWENKVPKMLAVNKDPIHTLQDIVWAMQELRTYHAVRVFVIDYLQLAWVLESKSLLDQITEVSHRIRGLAKDHKLLTIGLSQFTREASKDHQNPPTVNSLYGGAPLENDSDQVVLLDHTTYKKQGETTATQKLLLAKNRHGGVGFVPIAWDYETLRLYEVPDDGQYNDADDTPF